MSANAQDVGVSTATGAHEQAEITEAESFERVTVQPKGTDTTPAPSSRTSHQPEHGVVEYTAAGGDEEAAHDPLPPRKKLFGYLMTRQFYIVLILSQVLAIAVTGTNTLTTLLFMAGTSIPAFQTLFNYVLLNLIYTSYSIYRKGFKGWFQMVYKDGWKFFILAFCDVEGNYFTVLAYQNTTILSAQLINFWAIAIVVLISLIFLKVRYHVFQYIGILICCAGLGLLVASDRIQGGSSSDALDAVKGDLFALLGATFYGLSNVYEEFMVSKRPLWEVLGQLAFWAMFINGVQAAIFDRGDFQGATWDGQVAGYLVGYTLILSLFYSFAPIVFRMASAAFFNIGLLTSNFWGLLIGLQVFGLTVHWLYPVAFVLIMIGHFVYYGTEGVMGEARKPWLSNDQADGVDGIGTARRKIEHPGATV